MNSFHDKIITATVVNVVLIWIFNNCVIILFNGVLLYCSTVSFIKFVNRSSCLSFETLYCAKLSLIEQPYRADNGAGRWSSASLNLRGRVAVAPFFLFSLNFRTQRHPVGYLQLRNVMWQSECVGACVCWLGTVRCSVCVCVRERGQGGRGGTPGLSSCVMLHWAGTVNSQISEQIFITHVHSNITKKSWLNKRLYIFNSIFKI